MNDPGRPETQPLPSANDSQLAAQGHIGMGQALLALGSPAEALAHFERAVELLERVTRDGTPVKDEPVEDLLAFQRRVEKIRAEAQAAANRLRRPSPPSIKPGTVLTGI